MNNLSAFLISAAVFLCLSAVNSIIRKDPIALIFTLFLMCAVNLFIGLVKLND